MWERIRGGRPVVLHGFNVTAAFSFKGWLYTYMTSPTTWFVLDALGGMSIEIPNKLLYVSETDNRANRTAYPCLLLHMLVLAGLCSGKTSANPAHRKGLCSGLGAAYGL